MEKRGQENDGHAGIPEVMTLSSFGGRFMEETVSLHKYLEKRPVASP